MAGHISGVTPPPVDGLRCEGLSVVFDDRAVITHTDLSVGLGEVTAVLGVSGSGKTSLLRAIAGFSPLAAGRVLLNRVDLTDRPPEQRPIGSLFQDARLFPALTVRSNVAFGLRVRGVARAEREEKAQALLDRVGLGARSHDTVNNLSGGEQQRVALARSLAIAPELILMDEPFSALDTPRRRDLRALVRELLIEHQTTSVVVTHDIADATTLASRIAVIDDGRIVQEGPIVDVMADPVSDAVADLLKV